MLSQGFGAGAIRLRPVTPEQLAEKILQALAALADDGAITVEGGLPRELKVERPKNPEHGDYATNVAMQLGKRAGMNPRAVRRAAGRQAADDEAITAVEIAGPGFINIRVAADAQGKIAAARSWTPARRTARSDSLHGPDDQPGVHLAPTRPARCTSATPAGRPSATRWPGCSTAAGAEVTREFYVNDRGAQMDKFGASPEGRGARRADPRGRLPRRVHQRPRQADRRRGPGHHRAAGGRAAGRVPRGGVRASARGAAEPARALPDQLRRLVLRAQPARAGRCRPRDREARASRATCTTPTTRSGCAPPTSPTTRTGS